MACSTWTTCRKATRCAASHCRDSHAAGPGNLVGRPLTEIERYYIEKTLEMTGGNREEAARKLGIGERTLYRVIQDWKAAGQDQAGPGRRRRRLGEAAGDLGHDAQRAQAQDQEMGMINNANQ